MIHDIDILESYGAVILDSISADDFFIPRPIVILNSSNNVCCRIRYIDDHGHDANLRVLFNELSYIMYREVMILLDEKALSMVKPRSPT